MCSAALRGNSILTSAFSTALSSVCFLHPFEVLSDLCFLILITSTYTPECEANQSNSYYHLPYCPGPGDNFSSPLRIKMPADYQSTARALALPVDDESPSRTGSPVWRRHRRSGSSFSGRPPTNYGNSWYGQMMSKSEDMGRRTISTFMRLSPLYRVLVVIAGLASLILGLLFLVYNERIFAWFSPHAQSWRERKGGWVLLWLATFFVSFPPMIGYSTCMTLAGFIYGVPNGYAIVFALKQRFNNLTLIHNL